MFDLNRDTLKNGLRLLTLPIEGSLSATVMVLVKAGSRYEEEKENGIAHFVEHMMFKGTKKRPTSKIIGMDIETIGGSSNAFTSYDYTGYYIKVPSEMISQACEIVSDLVKNGIFEQKEIAKEKGVIIEEIRMYEDRPMSKVSSLWFEKFFGNTPLGREITGSVESVTGIEQKHFFDFREEFYHGANIVVVLAGKLDTVNPNKLVEEHFGSIRQGKQSSFEAHSKKEVSSEIFQLQKDIEQSHLMIGGYGHNRSFEDRFKFRVADAIFSEGFGSRLFQVIRDELGLAYYVYASLSSFEDIGVYRVGLGVENSKVNQATEAVIKEMNKLLKGEFDEEEVDRARNYLIGNLATDLESTDEIAIWFGIQEILLNEVLTVEEVKKRILNVTRDDIIEVLNNIFFGQKLLMTAVTPKIEITNSLKDILHF